MGLVPGSASWFALTYAANRVFATSLLQNTKLVLSDTKSGVVLYLRALLAAIVARLKPFLPQGFTQRCNAFFKRQIKYGLTEVTVAVLLGLGTGRLLKALFRPKLGYAATRRQGLENDMEAARNYSDWYQAAKQLDKMDVDEEERQHKLICPTEPEELKQLENDTERLYGHELLEDLLGDPTDGSVRAVEDMVAALRAGLLHSVSALRSSRKAWTRRTRMPEADRRYMKEVRRMLHALVNNNFSGFSADQKFLMLQETQLAMGRSALVLSGGANLGFFHIGVVKVLLHERCLPRIVIGSSAGAIVGGILATHTTEELYDFIEQWPRFFAELMFWPDNTDKERFSHLFSTGSMMMGVELERSLRHLYGDLTFAEAYERTRRTFCLSICSNRPGERPRLLNHLTSPHVVIWSACSASSSFPGLFPARDVFAKDRSGNFVRYEAMAVPTTLERQGSCADDGLASPSGGKGNSCEAENGGWAPSWLSYDWWSGRVGGSAGKRKSGKKKVNRRQWRDGSLESDMPFQQVAETFNVHFFIVAQTNPHIIPLVNAKKVFDYVPGGHHLKWIGKLIEDEFRMRCMQVKRITESGIMFWLVSLFAQSWEGGEEDVTIVMPSSWKRMSRIVANLTQQELEETFMVGEQMTWPKVAYIKAHIAVELELAHCARKLQKVGRSASSAHGLGALAQRGAPQSPARVPSWNTLMQIAAGESEMEE